MDGAERAGRVLIAGAINTDLVARVTHAPAAGETVTGQSFAVFGGGKGANQAFAAARSGAATAILGAVGRDEFGRQRRADLEAEGIDVVDVATVDGVASGVALIVVDERGENRISYVPGATLTISPEQAIAAGERFRPRVVLTTLELPLPALEALYRTARRAGATLILNATPEPATGGALAGMADVLIVNETEATELLDLASGERDWQDVARDLGRLGPSVVVVTLGAAGAVVWADDATDRLPAPRVQVVDSTGAGDAFGGAFAARLATGGRIMDAARAGVVAGTIAVTRLGAQPSMPMRRDIDRMLGGAGAGA